MALRGKKRFIAAGLACTLLFAVLLLVRTDIISLRPAALPVARVQPAGDPGTGERWMVILQDDQRIGTSYSRLVPREGGYRLTENVHMRLNTMGLAQDLVLESSGWLNPDLTMDRFNFKMTSGLFTFAARGQVEDGHLVCLIRSGNDERRLRLPLEAPAYLPAGIFPALARTGLARGEHREFRIFDPATMAQERITLTVQDREAITLGGHVVAARKVLLVFKGVTQEIWLDDAGQILAENGLLGIRQERVSREEALHGQPATAGGDLTRVAAVVPDRELADPAALSRLTLQLDGVDLSPYALNDGRQRLEGRRLTLSRENLAGLPARLTPESLPEEAARLLAPTAFEQSDHPDIRTLAARLTVPDDPPLANLHRLVDWMQTHIERRPVLSLPDALSTLRNRRGDCNEHAVLLTALARAAGFPAQVEAGLVYLEGRFFYHAWNRVYLGRWVTADALFGQIPVDVTHIRLARGTAGEQLDILPLLGNLRIGVIEAK